MGEEAKGGVERDGEQPGSSWCKREKSEPKRKGACGLLGVSAGLNRSDCQWCQSLRQAGTCAMSAMPVPMASGRIRATRAPSPYARIRTQYKTATSAVQEAAGMAVVVPFRIPHSAAWHTRGIPNGSRGPHRHGGNVSCDVNGKPQPQPVGSALVPTLLRDTLAGSRATRMAVSAATYVSSSASGPSRLHLGRTAWPALQQQQRRLRRTAAGTGDRRKRRRDFGKDAYAREHGMHDDENDSFGFFRPFAVFTLGLLGIDALAGEELDDY
ncbi:hypothetical protein THASP1DRAFT_26482 [Thamnocephalis sphaerospora]|uniref:Uncharacterized protein n=1 Tax=Thamnocephalis sphaerospora TaxID=78915 RepID=A0A4P9XH29_9FUNG|nr:hypothetical protein THASP1DRAFT_26482 [Thamnocephalis sphaerospora]|eukprot:RKP04957.1 hypothetical protein THASP1DRAFT_26482 [Thamnocephalis sphaerospora]